VDGDSAVRGEMMRERLKIGLLLAAILVPLFAYTYHRGEVDGVAHYKQSKQFALTLDSMYRFGLMDGCTNDEICDMAGFGMSDDCGGNR
jgi:hypothetical protein